MIFKRFICGLAALMMVGICAATAHAADIVVALGASNTYGKGVSRDQTYPAHLQRMLKAKGINARVINAGINGNTTGQMLARLNSAVPPGTRVVILQPGRNDRRKASGGSEERNISAIRSRLQARKITVIMLPNHLLGSIRRESPAYDQGDGSHLTGKGYAALAASILPEVLAAIGK